MLRSARLSLLAASALVISIALAACGSENSDGTGADPKEHDGFGDSGVDPSAVKRLFFDPPTTTVTIDGTNPQSASYTLKAELGDGSIGDVMAESFQFDRPDLAKVAPGNPVVATAAGPFGGVGKIHAIYKGQEALAELRIVVKVEYIDPSADPDGVSALKGSPLGQDPNVSTLLYPYDKTVFPLGLASPLVMWNAPQANDTYRIHFDEDNYTFDGYYKVGALGQQRVEQAVWDHLTASNGGSPLHLKVARYDAVAKIAYESASQAWTIAPASMRGAIYYWTTSGGGHLSKIQPGTGGTPVQLGEGKCMGCHAVSADGNTLVAAVENGLVNRSWVSFDLPGATPPATVRKDGAQFAANVAVNPNGKYVVYGGGPMHIADTTSGTPITTSNLETTPLDPGMAVLTHPAFSPDGKHLAAVQSSADWISWQDSKLMTLDFDEATQVFSNPKGLVGSGAFPATERAIAYPSFAPDSQQIAFHVADYATGCNATGCDANTKGIGSIWLQNASGSAPIRLDALNDSSLAAKDHDLSYEPTFNPIERGGYFWVVFTSTRDWGNKPEVSGPANNGKKRLWIAAIDKATGTTDPSHPAFFLEGQELDTMNMRGFWALASCKSAAVSQGDGAEGTCAAGFECCSGFCDQGKCIDVTEIACRAIGEACVETSDCCNSPTIQCVGGKCVSPVH